jgi:cytoplasmic iron level regulating protein YaaA (DUF328/UPF0246 family)
VIVLLHSSKTMRSPGSDGAALRRPALLTKARELARYVKTLPPGQLAKVMKISPDLAETTHALMASWSTAPKRQSPAIDSFVGDIYSGLGAGTLSAADRAYADEHLRILSGLYGVLRPFDGISAYRLEMGYKLPDRRYANLYEFWGNAVAKTLPKTGTIVNLTAAEYSRVVLPFVDRGRAVTPKFLTVNEKTGAPSFVVVHAKIARGAFARWLVQSRTADADRLGEFAEIGYRFDEGLSKAREPVFVCESFGGKGMSVRSPHGGTPRHEV